MLATLLFLKANSFSNIYTTRNTVHTFQLLRVRASNLNIKRNQDGFRAHCHVHVAAADVTNR